MITARDNVTRNARRHRRRSQDMRAFDAHIASPFDLGVGLGNPYTMPAGGRLGIAVNAPFAAGDLTATTGGTARATPAGAASEVQPLGWYETNQALTLASAVAGTVTLSVFDVYGVPKPIATGTVV